CDGPLARRAPALRRPGPFSRPRPRPGRATAAGRRAQAAGPGRQEARAMSEPLVEEIAIVGMTGRFPGAPDLRRFWQNLAGGVDGISRFTDEELLAAGVSPELLADPRYV